VLLLPPAALAQSPEPSGPFAARHVTCDRIELRWIYEGQFTVGPESIVLVLDRAGTTGIRFFVDREHSQVTHVESWEEVGGIVNTTSIPGSPRIDYVNCIPASDPIGGITLENARSVIEAGAAAVAVISDLLLGNDPRGRTQAFLHRLTS